MAQIIEFIGNHPALTGALFALIALLFFTESKKGGQTISSQELTHVINQQSGIVLDVRESKEYRSGHIIDSIHIPFSQLKDRISEITKHESHPIVVVDQRGQHSGHVVRQIKQNGITKVMRLKGGLISWTNDGLPLIKG